MSSAKKARCELDADDLTDLDVVESIASATGIYKVIRSASPYRTRRREMLYIIISANLTGLPIYTKGKLVREAGEDVYYFLVSSKRAQ